MLVYHYKLIEMFNSALLLLFCPLLFKTLDTEDHACALQSYCSA